MPPFSTHSNPINQFLLGTIVLACFVIGMFFLRFWRKTHDRLFAIFAAAFWLMGLNWLLLAFVQQDEVKTWLYLLRLGAFVAILIGIIDKNRSRRLPQSESSPLE
jgi:Ca2+/Na+ antiporter